MEFSRKSIRLKKHDYSSSGLYFLTICTYRKECLFGEILNGKLALNPAGNEASQIWKAIPEYFSQVILDEFIVMPHHVHGVIEILAGAGRSETVGAIVRGFKIGVTKWLRKNTDIFRVWQRNYYEHIIRSPQELIRIQNYIKINPSRWHAS